MRAASCRRAALLAGVSLLVAVPSAAARATSDAPAPSTMLFQADGKDLTEASGIAADPSSSLFFVNQDAGDPPDIYVFNRTGRVRAFVHVNQLNHDWEDIGSGLDVDGKPVLHISDTGNAYVARHRAGLAARTEFAVIQIDQPRLSPLGPTVRINATNTHVFRFEYSDKKSHDAETLLVQPRTNTYFVADKTQKPELPAYLWAGPREPSEQKLNVFTMVGGIPVTGASGGAMSPEGDRMVIRNSSYAYLWHITRGNVAQALTTPPITITLPVQKQGEGVAFAADGRSLIVNGEGRNQGVWEVGLPQEAQSKLPPDLVTTVDPPADKRLDQGALLISGMAVVSVLAIGGFIQLRRRRHRPVRRPSARSASFSARE